MFSSYARRHSGFYREGKKLLYTQYFDPQKFPDWETMGPVLGGFPAYFTVTVDIANETVAEHYASPL